MSITVKVIRVPGQSVEVGLSDGATVQDALNSAGITPQSNEKIEIDGQPVTLRTTVYNGNRITLSAGAKGAL